MTMTTTVRRLVASLLAAALLALPFGSVATAGGGGGGGRNICDGPMHVPIPCTPGQDPSKPGMFCDLPNPAYEGCRAEVECATGAVGNAYCKLNAMSFCNRVLDAKKNGEDLIKLAVGAAVCSALMPSAWQLLAINLSAATGGCVAATVGDGKDKQVQALRTFCDTLAAIPDQVCPGPKMLNTCPPPDSTNCGGETISINTQKMSREDAERLGMKAWVVNHCMEGGCRGATSSCGVTGWGSNMCWVSCSYTPYVEFFVYVEARGKRILDGHRLTKTHCNKVDVQLGGPKGDSVCLDCGDWHWCSETLFPFTLR